MVKRKRKRTGVNGMGIMMHRNVQRKRRNVSTMRINKMMDELKEVKRRKR